MPRGPRGERRPADVIGNAVKVMRIAPAVTGPAAWEARGRRQGKGSDPREAGGDRSEGSGEAVGVEIRGLTWYFLASRSW
jgi:hypothetical protein